VYFNKRNDDDDEALPAQSRTKKKDFRET